MGMGVIDSLRTQEVCTCVRGREGAVNLHLCASALMFHFLNTTRLLSGAGALTGLNKTLSHC